MKTRVFALLCLPYALSLGQAPSAPAPQNAASDVESEGGYRREFRLWMAGHESGGRIESRKGPNLIESREWLKLERLGTQIEQEVRQSVEKTAKGNLTFTWFVKLSSDPMEGTAHWSPQNPKAMRIQPKNMPEQTLELSAKSTLWPPDQDRLLKHAAQTRTAITLRGFSAAIQKNTELQLSPIGPSPLPGFPDAVHFKGLSKEGAMVANVEMWVSPTQGELKQVAHLGGIPILMQRKELPAPKASVGPGLFEQTLKTLPPHPFLPWIENCVLRWEGKGSPAVPESEQQRALWGKRVHLFGTRAPSPEEASQKPVHLAQASKEEAPYLKASPLVPFEDPLFEGLVKRLNPAPSASRWELAKAVNHFVFEWIESKDYTVGFASALEVARQAKGDCTEHGVLSVALLRKLGVPARGVLGWVGLGDTLGLHFWVEVKLQNRWVSLDPTFDQAPASTLRIKMNDTDLADLGSIGWDSAQQHLSQGQWVPEGDWTRDIQIQKSQLRHGALKMQHSETWRLHSGILSLGAHQVQGIPSPSALQLRQSKALMAPQCRRTGYLNPQGQLWIPIQADRWLQIERLNSSQAIEMLEKLEFKIES